MLTAGFSQHIECGIQSGALAGTRGARYQYHSLRHGQELSHAVSDVRRKPQAGKTQQRRGGFQEPHDHFFAVLRGQAGNPHVNSMRTYGHHESSVLRGAPFADVQIRENLHARDERVLNRFRGFHQLPKHSIHADADDRISRLRLDMNVAGLLGDRLADDLRDQPDGRRVLPGQLSLDVLHRLAIGLPRTGRNKFDFREGFRGRRRRGTRFAVCFAGL